MLNYLDVVSIKKKSAGKKIKYFAVMADGEEILVLTSGRNYYKAFAYPAIIKSGPSGFGAYFSFGKDISGDWKYVIKGGESWSDWKPGMATEPRVFNVTEEPV